jgi:hypothetical protein
MDLLAIPRRTPAFRTGLTHMALNLTVVSERGIPPGEAGHLIDRIPAAVVSACWVSPA